MSGLTWQNAVLQSGLTLEVATLSMMTISKMAPEEQQEELKDPEKMDLWKAWTLVEKQQEESSAAVGKAEEKDAIDTSVEEEKNEEILLTKGKLVIDALQFP